MLAGLRGDREMAMDEITPTRLVTVDYFIKEMLGYKHRSTYYNHLDVPGWPQRVYPGGKPMLVLAECEAFMAKLLAERTPQKVVKHRKEPDPLKRHPGRPAKVLRPPVAEEGC